MEACTALTSLTIFSNELTTREITTRCSSNTGRDEPVGCAIGALAPAPTFLCGLGRLRQLVLHIEGLPGAMLPQLSCLTALTELTLRGFCDSYLPAELAAGPDPIPAALWAALAALPQLEALAVDASPDGDGVLTLPAAAWAALAAAGGRLTQLEFGCQCYGTWRPEPDQPASIMVQEGATALPALQCVELRGAAESLGDLWASSSLTHLQLGIGMQLEQSILASHQAMSLGALPALRSLKVEASSEIEALPWVGSTDKQLCALGAGLAGTGVARRSYPAAQVLQTLPGVTRPCPPVQAGRRQ